MKHRSFNQLRSKMSSDRRKRNARAADREIGKMLLADLRKASGYSQRELAAALGIKQPSLAQVERQDDIQISTLKRLIKALGGELDLVVRLPVGVFRVTQF